MTAKYDNFVLFEHIKPEIYKKAKTSEESGKWLAALKEELESLSNHNTWIHVNRRRLIDGVTQLNIPRNLFSITNYLNVTTLNRDGVLETTWRTAPAKTQKAQVRPLKPVVDPRPPFPKCSGLFGQREKGTLPRTAAPRKNPTKSKTKCHQRPRCCCRIHATTGSGDRQNRKVPPIKDAPFLKEGNR
ncbi:hypothetical protein TNIN_490211 [Trichonephila inaurata madagascariensis]|uniref:Uncharacterized protein n=1 Tax=Trichonephila inaurata madagascariensis TaxID=2747483 RepID=A0A8X6IK07_9ARAC|nr:hypothetical protein TNIN_490211 [Trichonephila inaurata madagascariensis]